MADNVPLADVANDVVLTIEPEPEPAAEPAAEPAVTLEPEPEPEPEAVFDQAEPEPEPGPEPTVEPEPEPAVEPAGPVFYREVRLGASLAPERFGAVAKTGGLYAACLASPLVVQTPVVRLAGPPTESHAHLGLPPGFARFAREAERLVLDAALARREDWFRRAVDPGALRASFKSFVRDDAREVRDGDGPASAAAWLRVRVSDDLAAFDAAGEPLDADDLVDLGGARVRAVLRLDRACFGRTEFGAVWALDQLQLAPAPPVRRCLIDPAADERARGAGAPAGAEFL